MELFLLRLTPYKENDFIITALGENALVTFKAAGLSKPTSKLAGVVTLYGLIDAELEEKKSGYVVSHARAISKNYKLINDYDKLSVLNFIGELVLRSINNDEDAHIVFNFVKATLFALENYGEPFTLAFVTLLKMIQTLGYGLNLESCVACGTKNDLVALDYIQGGFVCRTHYHQSSSRALSVEALKNIRYASLVPSDKLEVFIINKDALKELFDGVIAFYQDATGVQLKSYPILRQVLFQLH